VRHQADQTLTGSTMRSGTVQTVALLHLPSAARIDGGMSVPEPRWPSCT